MPGPPFDPELDQEFESLFAASLAEVLALPWHHKRVFTLRQVHVLLRMQLRACAQRSYEALVLAHLLDIMDATPSLARKQVRAAYEHIQETPGLPSMASDSSVFFALQDWLYGCPNAVLKVLAPEDAMELDLAVPPERHLRLVGPEDRRWLREHLNARVCTDKIQSLVVP